MGNEPVWQMFNMIPGSSQEFMKIFLSRPHYIMLTAKLFKHYIVSAGREMSEPLNNERNEARTKQLTVKYRVTKNQRQINVRSSLR